jgi:hypothetical protein
LEEGRGREARGQGENRRKGGKQTTNTSRHVLFFLFAVAGGLEDVDEGVLRSWVKQYSMRLNLFFLSFSPCLLSPLSSLPHFCSRPSPHQRLIVRSISRRHRQAKVSEGSTDKVESKKRQNNNFIRGRTDSTGHTKEL